jgi:hypothetical protein
MNNDDGLWGLSECATDWVIAVISVVVMVLAMVWIIWAVTS